MNGPATSQVRIRDCDIPVMRAGSGAPLLLLPGAYDGDGWHPYMAALARHFDVIVPRHPGFGCAMPDWLDSISDLANFYLEFMAVGQLDGVHLVGAALGGWIAAELATRNTARLASLTLAAPFGARLPGVSGVDLFAASDEQALRDAVQDPALAATLIEQARPGEDAWLHTRVTVAKLCWQPRLHDPQLQKWLHRIDLPTLLLWGEQDRVAPVALAREWQRLIPGARLELLANCGHLPTLEQPDSVANLIAGFVAEARIAA